MLKQDQARPLPFFYVGRKVTKQRVAKFLKTKHVLLSKELNKPETKAVWYTRDHISLLLEEMDHAGADGLRIYLGAYEEHENYSGQLCLLMVMTKANLKTGGHMDITVEDASDFQSRSIDNTSPRDFNVGSPCPPICDEEGMEFTEEKVS